ncbi:MAG: NAD(P)H-dependent oxidoreductase subunit E [Actinomycetota bacterium]|nr:NAD(P)H-dependent oxidoreductase subunit E [Actinomycetota bacterium]
MSQDRCTCAEEQETREIDLALLDPVFERYADDPGALIPVLQATQETYGYLPEPAIRAVASARNVPLSEVYGVATFYAQFHLRPRAETIVRICHGTACHVRGAPEVTRAVVEELGVKVGETTQDLAFTIESVACVGCCCLAPVMLVGSETYGQLDVVQTRRIAASLREKADERKDALE